MHTLGNREDRLKLRAILPVEWTRREVRRGGRKMGGVRGETRTSREVRVGGRWSGCGLIPTARCSNTTGKWNILFVV